MQGFKLICVNLGCDNETDSPVDALTSGYVHVEASTDPDIDASHTGLCGVCSEAGHGRLWEEWAAADSQEAVAC